MREYGERLAKCITDAGVGLVGLVDFSEFDQSIYHNYAWQTIARMARHSNSLETWEAAFVLFGITKCVSENYADNDRDVDASVWGAIGTRLEESKPVRDQRHPRTLRQVEHRLLGEAFRQSLRRFRLPHPSTDYGIEGLTNIGPMLFHAGFAGATIKPVVRLIRRAYESLNGFDNTADPDVRRQWVSTTSSQAVQQLHTWPRRMLASHIPTVDELWQTLVTVVRLHDEDDHPWTLEDLADFGIPGVHSTNLIDALNEGRVVRNANRTKRQGVQSRLYFGHEDEVACPRLFIGEDVTAPAIEQWDNEQWVPYEARYTKTRIGLFADLDVPIVGSKLRLLDQDKEIRQWNLTGKFPGFVFTRRGGAIIDAKTVGNAGLFSGERLVLLNGTPNFHGGVVASQLDFVWDYHKSTKPWTAWMVLVPDNATELKFELNGEKHSVPVCRDRYSPICFLTAPCDAVTAVSQDGHAMSLYSSHPVVQQNGAREMTVVCDLEGSRFTLQRKNYRRKLTVCGGEPLTEGAGVFQIRRCQYPQLEVARYAVIPDFQIKPLEEDVSKPARFEIKADDSLGVFTSESDACKLIHETTDDRWILETARDQPTQDLQWRPRTDKEDEASRPGEPVRLRVSVEGVRWRLISKADGSRVPRSEWTNKRLPVRQDMANREAMELDVCVPGGWKLIANDEAIMARPSRTTAGDVYRIRLAGQERPKFETPDGTVFEPAILSTHPVISSSQLESNDLTSLVHISGKGEFLNDLTVWAWPTLNLKNPPVEAQVISEGSSFLFQLPRQDDNQTISLDSPSVFSLVMGHRDSGPTHTKSLGFQGLARGILDSSQPSCDASRYSPCRRLA